MNHNNRNAREEKPLTATQQIEKILGSTDPNEQLPRLQSLLRLASTPASAGVLITAAAHNLNRPPNIVAFPDAMTLGNVLTLLRNAEQLVLTQIVRQETAANHTHPETPPEPEPEKEKSS